MARLSFSFAENDMVEVGGGKDSFRNLRSMIALDIHTNQEVCLEYLCSIAEVESGVVADDVQIGEV